MAKKSKPVSSKTKRAVPKKAAVKPAPSKAKKAIPQKGVKKTPAKKVASKPIISKGKKAPVKKTTPKKVAVKKPVAKKAVVKKPVTKVIAIKKPAAVKPAPAKKALKTALPVRNKNVAKKQTVPVAVPIQLPDALVVNAANIGHPMIQPGDGLTETAAATEDTVKSFDKNVFNKATAKGDPHSNRNLSSKPKNAIKPSGKKPLW